jgi:hypothetical protein
MRNWEWSPDGAGRSGFHLQEATIKLNRPAIGPAGADS